MKDSSSQSCPTPLCGCWGEQPGACDSTYLEKNPVLSIIGLNCAMMSWGADLLLTWK